MRPGQQAQIRLNEETYVIVNADNFSSEAAISDNNGSLNFTDATVALEQHMAEHPEAQGQLQMVPANEYEEIIMEAV